MPLISEPIEPDVATIDPAALTRGEPELPSAFTWRERRYHVAAVERTWRTWRLDRGDRYIDRHWWQILTATGERMRIYCLRHERTNRRWFLFAID